MGPALASRLTPGVRALFTGPSGTGKSMAAGLLASALQMDLYRLDLSAVVNKYIGETEKNLNQIFTLAEELDVVLLIDEGDSLMTRRTDVQTSNDRYANLETNYLLQRVESYDGILIVTTNAADRIDGAFQPPDGRGRGLRSSWGVGTLGHLALAPAARTRGRRRAAARTGVPVHPDRRADP